MTHIFFKVETEREEDGRWIAEIPDVSGVMAYARSKVAAIASVKALAVLVTNSKKRELTLPKSQLVRRESQSK